MKTQHEKHQEELTKLYRRIIKSLGLDKTIAEFGEKDVKWAITRYLVSVRERSRLLKEKAAAEEALKEIERKI